MTKLEAIKELQKYDHAFLSPEGMNEIGKPFDIKYDGEYSFNEPHVFKGLNCPGYKDGEKVLGIEAHILAEMICKKEGVKYTQFFGIGSQLRGCCEAMIKHLTK